MGTFNKLTSPSHFALKILNWHIILFSYNTCIYLQHVRSGMGAVTLNVNYAHRYHYALITFFFNPQKNI